MNRRVGGSRPCALPGSYDKPRKASTVSNPLIERELRTYLACVDLGADGVHLKTAFTLSLILALVGIPGFSSAAEQDTAGMMAFCREPVLTPSRGFFGGSFEC